MCDELVSKCNEWIVEVWFVVNDEIFPRGCETCKWFVACPVVHKHEDPGNVDFVPPFVVFTLVATGTSVPWAASAFGVVSTLYPQSTEMIFLRQNFDQWLAARICAFFMFVVS